MKTIKLIVFLFAFTLGFVSCIEEKPLLSDESVEEVASFITGVSQSLEYSFDPGRLEETPAEVRELYITVLDDNGEMVYEQWYFNHNYWAYMDSTLENGDIYYFENTIPDTLFLPGLPIGNYDVLASTTYLNFYGDPIWNPDGTWTEGAMIYPRIEPYCVSENPIYVGKTSIELQQDGQEVQVEMRNVSTRITLSREEDTSGMTGGRLELVFKATNNRYFSFEQDALVSQNFDYDYHIYTYMFEENKRHFYTLPRTLVGVNIAYFHDQMEMYNFSIDIPFDPSINLEVNDAISFSIALDELLEGANSGTLWWEDIVWNDKGNISIP